MNIQPEISKLDRNAFWHTLKDGLLETYLGFFFILYAGMCEAAANYFKTDFPTIIFIFYGAFGFFILELLRRKISYPRIGYARYQVKINPVFAALVILPTILFPVVLAINKRFFDDMWDAGLFIRLSPVVFGIIFAIVFYHIAVKAELKIYWAFLLISLAAGFSAPALSAEDINAGFIMFFVLMGLLMSVHGIYLFIVFVRNNPVIKDDEDCDDKQE